MITISDVVYLSDALIKGSVSQEIIDRIVLRIPTDEWAYFLQRLSRDLWIEPNSNYKFYKIHGIRCEEDHDS